MKQITMTDEAYDLLTEIMSDGGSYSLLIDTLKDMENEEPGGKWVLWLYT